jgi:xylulokinase
MTTGNGFPAPLYSVFKIMWYRDHEPAMFEETDTFIGTKDFINHRLTGRIATDYSYASGSGVWDLRSWRYDEELIAASGLPRSLFPEALASSEVMGTLTGEAADALGLHPGVQVVAGGVDNSCMALGARNTAEGRVYNSLGSSSWIAVCSAQPLLHPRVRPFVFAHVMPGLFTSATSIFSAGTSLNWVRDHLCRDLISLAGERGENVFDLMIEEARASVPGAHGLLFNPSLGGGTSQDASPHIRGAFLGLDLGHGRDDVIRATLEGIALGLRLALDELRALADLAPEILVVGGGSKSPFWRQIFADVYGMRVVKTNIDQQAAALGAAALAAVGAGIWEDFSIIDDIHEVQSTAEPDSARRKTYDRLVPVFRQAGDDLARLGDAMAAL